MTTSPRILIVRMSAVGDVIHGVPVLNALRAKYPQAYLGWAIEGRAADLIEGHPALDALIRLPRRWIRSVKKTLEVRRALRAHRFDITVDLQCLTKSAVAAWLSGAPRRIGAAGTNGRELSKWLNNELVDVRAEHVIEHYLQIARPLGIDTNQVEFRLPEQPAETEFAEGFLTEVVLTRGSYAIISPGAGWASKMWPIERYVALAHYLGLRRNLRTVVAWGSAEEKTLAEAIVEHAAQHACLAPPTSLPQLAALTRRARLFVGSDTGPMHLAVAVGTPTISLHGTSRAEWTGAYGGDNLRLQARYDDGSARQRRRAGNEAMCAITVEEVCGACEKLLGRTPPRPHFLAPGAASRRGQSA